MDTLLACQLEHAYAENASRSTRERNMSEDRQLYTRPVEHRAIYHDNRVRSVGLLYGILSGFNVDV